MEGEQGADVDVGNAVAIGHAEGLVRRKQMGDALEAPAGHRLRAGVDDRHPPVGRRLAQVLGDRPGGDVDGEIAVVEDEIGEILLDQRAL